VREQSDGQPIPVEHDGDDVGPTRLLEVRDLSVAFVTGSGQATAVDGVNLSLDRGRTLAIVGESGSGKSMMGKAILGLQPRSGCVVSGQVWVEGEQLVGKPQRRLRHLRGTTMAMVFQDPLAALHPYYRVGWQIVESIRATRSGVSRRGAHSRAVEMLRRVGFADPEKRLRDYPHQLSGGMRQRAMIAMALVRQPRLLIADEPTTALDVTVQAQILALIKDLQREYDAGVILITHDLGVAAETADDVLVMYGGQVMERGPIDVVLTTPGHPYTWGLLRSVTRLDRERQTRLEPIPGQPARAGRVPAGCPFHPRCRYAERLDGRCAVERPVLRDIAGGHQIACHLPDEQREQIVREEIMPLLEESTATASNGQSE
jgi:peptide/nickel transport system ATP-binding protein